MNKKLYWVLAVLVVGALVLTACTPAEPADEPEVEEVSGEDAEAEADTEEEDAPPEEVTLRIFTRWSDASPVSQAFRDRVAEFQILYPHITIEDESINDEQANISKWNTYIATDDLPAIFQNYGGSSAYEWIANGLFLDLDEALEANPEWRDGFLDFFSQWQYDDIPGTYGVPYEFFAVPLFYNKDIFEEVGVDVPTTMAEFAEVSEQLLAAGYVPMAFGEKDNFKGDHLWAVLGLRRLGIDGMAGVATGETEFTGAGMRSVFETMEEWNEAGYVGENAVGVDYATETAMFLSGEAAMKFDGSWVLSEMDASPIADSIGVAPFPYFAAQPENRDLMFGGPAAGLSVNANLTGAELEAALMLLEFLSSVEHFTYLQETTNGGVYPAVMEPASSVGPVTAEYIEVLNNAGEFSIGAVGVLPEVLTQVRNSVQGLFAGQSVDEVLQEITAVQEDVEE